MVFECADVVLVRAALRSVSETWAGWPNVGEGDPDEAVTLSRWLRIVGGDPVVREALEVSSSSLSRHLDVLMAGGGLGIGELRRVALAVTRYLLRAGTRATPFGLFAGVSVGTFDDDAPQAWWGSAHRKGVRPDMGWLRAWVARCEQSAEVLRGLRVVVNNLCFVRGDRLVLPYLPVADSLTTNGRARTHEQASELSVRFSAPVRLVVDMAARPVEFVRLEREVRGRFPDSPPAVATGMLCELVKRGVLLSELQPPPEAADPLGHVLDRLTAVCNLADVPDLAADVEELRTVHTELASYAKVALGEGRDLLRSVCEQMRRVHASDRLVQVDLAWDTRVVLPHAVGVEVEHTAGVLCRVGGMPSLGAAASHLRQFHADFLDRYGVGVLVPVKEVLDPDIGLGAPSGYRIPPSSRAPRQHYDTAVEERDRLLAGLVQQATVEGCPEIVLDDTLVARLDRSGDASAPPPAVELCGHLLADSVSAMAAGDFRFVVTNAALAGRMLGRFASLFNQADRDRVADLARTVPVGDSAAVRAQLRFPAHHSRAGNVAQIPQWLEHSIPVGIFADPGDRQVLALDDLAVYADWHRLRVVSCFLNREVAPTVFHSLNMRAHAPNLVRLLLEVAQSGVCSWPSWNWGVAEALPWLPRVRVGRTVLRSARWRVDQTELADPRISADRWRQSFERWRARWAVPDTVYLAGVGDQRIALDLTVGLHLRVLRQKLTRAGSVTLLEIPAGGERGPDWLAGHVNEIVFPLLATTCDARSRTEPSTAAILVRHRGEEHLPGGRWLYTKVYCSAARHGELLSSHLPGLLAELPASVDQWWFVRYLDPQPHLRLRFRGDPAVLTGQVLPLMRDWMCGLRQAGLAGRLQIDTYVPEVGRYGGPDAITAAERVFHADSEAVVSQLRDWVQPSDLDLLVAAAANYVDITCHLMGSTDAGLTWLAATGRSATPRPASPQQRRETMRLIDPRGDWRALRATPGGQEVLRTWAHRRTALKDYRDCLHAARGLAAPGDVLTSLLHMHHNRLVGVDQTAEQRCLELARAAAQSCLARNGPDEE